MTVISLIGGLFGCQKAPRAAQHTLSQVTAVSISCGHMDRRYGYSFWARRGENGWLLDGECFTQGFETETVLKDCMLDSEETEDLLEILKCNESIAYVENYKEPKTLAFQVADGETYGFCLCFSDGSQYAASTKQADLEKFFYRLAEKYAQTISKS